MRLLVTGGCGFIGSNFLRYILEHYQPAFVTNVDALTYAGNHENVAKLGAEYGARYEFYEADIANISQMEKLMLQHSYFAAINFAAESHVDRSINSPRNFIHTNVIGASSLLEACRLHGVKRFIQISTGKVYGSLKSGGFKEDAALAPSSPYAASKAAADLLALSYWRTYGMETIILRGANNFGPYQHRENFIPDCVRKALADEAVPVHQDGGMIRDWMHVDDYCSAIVAALLEGKPGEIYHVAAGLELSMLEIIEMILDESGKPRDRMCQMPLRTDLDARFALDWSKIRDELGWKPIRTSRETLAEVIRWWIKRMR